MSADDGEASGIRLSRSSQNEALAFTTTHWSVVLEAKGPTPVAQAALERLCRTYWRPIYGFVRRQGIEPEEAKDLTQGFFALILERKDFQSVRQEKGRLRSFLLASVKHFMANERRDATTIKRGGGRTVIPLDWIGSDDSAEFDRGDTIDNDYAFRFKDFTFNAQNVFTGWVIIAGQLTVDKTGNANTGPATVEVYNPNGVLVATLCAEAAGTRFEL